MADSIVLYEVKNGIAYITMNRPERRNALNKELCEGLGKAWDRFEKDTEAWVAVFSGAGKGFCSGWDLTPGPGQATQEEVQRSNPANGITVFKPIIGAVHGFAIGAGSSLAITGCDLTIAAEGTEIAWPEPRVGATVTPVEYIPYLPFKLSLEFRFITSTQRMSAQRAYEVGLVNKVVPEAELMAEATKMAEMIKNIPPLAAKAIKYGHYKVMDTMSRRARWEYDNFVLPQLGTEDKKEALTAFLEKRAPVFKGK